MTDWKSFLKMTDWKSFLKKARRSEQTTFEPSAVLPDDEGRVFVTDVAGAPLRVIGRLGRDGKWYIGQVGIDPPHEEEGLLEEAEARGLIVLRDEPVAEHLIRQGIRQFLSRSKVALSDSFLARLRDSRFKDEIDRYERRRQEAMADQPLPLLWIFEREVEIEREGFLLAGWLAIDPRLDDAELEKVVNYLLRMLRDGELQPTTTGWVDGTAPLGDFTKEHWSAIRTWSLKARRISVRVVKQPEMLQ
jgi:hypothetical protein